MDSAGLVLGIVDQSFDVNGKLNIWVVIFEFEDTPQVFLIGYNVFEFKLEQRSLFWIFSDFVDMSWIHAFFL